MINYVKIDRTNGDVVAKRREPSELTGRVFNKAFVWIELVKEPQPSYGTITHRIERTVTQPDLSDLQVDVNPSSQRVEGWSIIALTSQELDARADEETQGTLRSIKPLIMALNDGSFIPGSNYTVAEIKSILKAHR